MIRKTSETRALAGNIVNAYSESQNSTYSCNYVNNMMDYSTTEVNTGKKWIDGKDIYRKVITGSLNSGATVLSNPDSLIYFGGSATLASANRVLPYYEIYNNQKYEFTINSDSSNIWRTIINAQGSSATATNCKIVLEYTKSS